MMRIAGLLGVVGALMAFAFPVVFGAMDPAYDASRDYISELGATGAPNAAAVNGFGFLPTGIVLSLFAMAGWAVLPRSAGSFVGFVGILFFAAGYVGAAFFACDAGCRPSEPSFNQTMHSLFGLPGYFTAPVFMASLAIAARGWPGGGWLSLVAGLGTVATAVGLASFLPDSPQSGFWQRVLEAGVLTWILACGCYLLTRGNRLESRRASIDLPVRRE